MKLHTTAWGSKELHYFDTLVFLHCNNHWSYKPVYTPIRQVSLKDGSLKVAKFFKDVSALVVSKKVLRTLTTEETESYQIGVQGPKGELYPLKWFTLELDDGTIISHDMACLTIFVKKNGFHVPFGVFDFTKRQNYARYREFNIMRNAYRYIGNQVMKSFKKVK